MPSTNFKSSPAPEKDISSAVEQPSDLETKKPEVQTTPETKLPEYREDVEKQMEVKEGGKFLDETIENLKNTLKRSKKKPTDIPQVRDEVTIKVENIMQEGLEDAFNSLTSIQQQEFKIQGEKTALEIRSLLRAGKVKVNKILQLLIGWLKLLPGINRFFLEQEAKIKADKIISLKKMNDNM